MIRSFAFTTQGRLHSKDIEMFLMPTLLADTNLFLWVDLEKPTAEETKFVLYAHAPIVRLQARFHRS